MPLTTQQAVAFSGAIESYSFPAVLRGFAVKQRDTGLTMTDVEKRIHADLRSGDPARVREGLSNVLYWGFAQMGGLAVSRSDAFIDRAKGPQLQAATKLFFLNPRPLLLEIKKLGLPQFSAMSFVSKIRMFLDPAGSATLDKQILKMKYVSPGTVLEQVVSSPWADRACREATQSVSSPRPSPFRDALQVSP